MTAADGSARLCPWFAALVATGDPVGDVRRFLRAAGRADTLRHVSRVATQDRRLARCLRLRHASSDRACCAHDLAAVVPQRASLRAAEAVAVPLPEADRQIPQVVHGALAAAVLRPGWASHAVLAVSRFGGPGRAAAGVGVHPKLLAAHAELRPD
jgi:hypothetical protein